MPMQGVLIGVIAGGDLLLGLHLAQAQARLRRLARRVRRARHRRSDRHLARRRVRGRRAVGERRKCRGGISGLLEGNPQQVLAQLYGIVVTLVWSGVVTFVILKMIGAMVPLRVRHEDEVMGLDVSQHGEALQ